MSYIAPNSDIKLLTNCPLEPNYEHSIYFDWVADGATRQANYFASLALITLSNYSYQRVDKGKIRIAVTEQQESALYRCNYMMFRNTSFNRKWFYAFITGIEYINNKTYEISYKIDVLQTWHFDYDLPQVFVERCHNVTDVIGENLVEENVELGDYIYEDLGNTGLFGLNSIVVATSVNNDTNFTPSDGAMYGGIYSGLRFLVFQSASATNEFLKKLTTAGKSDAIVSVFMFPTALMYSGTTLSASPVTVDIHRDKNYSNGTIGGYIVRNNKLFTAPYNQLYVSDNNGNGAQFNFEYFSTSSCHFDVVGVLSCTPEVLLIPKNYKGCSVNYNEKLSNKDFPQCAYVIDSFRAWLAQNQFNLANTGANLAMNGAIIGSSVAGTGTALAVAGAVANPIGAVVGAGLALSSLRTIGSTIAQVRTASLLPAHANGQQTNVANTAIGENGFRFYYAYCRAEYLRIIDDYFDRYGYATHRNIVPNRHARPHWTYVKTVGCNIISTIPSDVADEICAIYDKGITWWINGSEVGNYSLDNRPV